MRKRTNRKKINIIFNTINVAKETVGLKSTEEQIIELSQLQESFDRFCLNTETAEDRANIYNCFNIINALASMPDVLTGDVSDFCIEVSDTIKSIVTSRKINKRKVTDSEKEYLTNLHLLYINVLENVSIGTLDKAIKYVGKRFENNSGVSKL